VTPSPANYSNLEGSNLRGFCFLEARRVQLSVIAGFKNRVIAKDAVICSILARGPFANERPVKAAWEKEGCGVFLYIFVAVLFLANQNRSFAKFSIPDNSERHGDHQSII
jgi:hypothetical protein